MFSCELPEVSHKSYYVEHLWMTAVAAGLTYSTVHLCIRSSDDLAFVSARLWNQQVVCEINVKARSSRPEMSCK